ncbi:MAG: hypothetical protein IJC21_03255 [Lentisphaeria bacterium]|nr:hypothetical protein [Lentisphaeria bacterium]
MSGNFKEYIKTPKGKLVCSLCALGAVWAVLIFNFLGGMKELVPSADKMRNAERELKRKKLAYEKVKAEKDEAEKVKEAFHAILRSSWQEQKHGMVESTLRQMISDTAKAQMLKLASLGSVKTSRINNDFYFAEIDVTFQARYPEVMRFIASIQKLEPQLSWKRFDIRPDFRSLRQMSANASSIAGMVAKNSGENIESAITVNFSGTIRIIGFDGDPRLLKNAELKK